jgi:hypothetical protein
MVRGARSSSRTSAARQSATLPPLSRKRSGRPSPSVSAWSLLLRPPRLIPIAWTSPPFSAACRAVRLHMCAVDQDFGGRSTRCRQCDEHLLPDAFRRRPHEPIVERLPRTVAGRCINPATARSHHVDDAADHPTVINPRNSSTLSGSNGRSRSNCSSLNQNSLKSTLLLSPSLNHIRAAKGIRFMGPDPRARRTGKPITYRLSVGVARNATRYCSWGLGV